VGSYLFKRLIQVPIVLWVLITISFFMMRLAPGGPFSGERNMDPVIEQKMKEKYHLDQSLPEQYALFMKDLVFSLDLGPSFKHKTLTVNEIIGEKFKVSAVLGGLAVFLALVLGLGVDSAVHVVHRARAEGGANLRLARTATARGVVFSALTTIAGFAGLLFSGHAGTASMAHLLMPGVAFTAACALVLVPALLPPRGEF